MKGIVLTFKQNPFITPDKVKCMCIQIGWVSLELLVVEAERESREKCGRHEGEQRTFFEISVGLSSWSLIRQGADGGVTRSLVLCNFVVDLGGLCCLQLVLFTCCTDKAIKVNPGLYSRCLEFPQSFIVHRLFQLSIASPIKHNLFLTISPGSLGSPMMFSLQISWILESYVKLFPLQLWMNL